MHHLSNQRQAEATAQTEAKQTKLHPQGNTRIQPAADIIGVHPQTLRRWWKTGKFPKPINIYGIPMFKNADILQWLDKHMGENA